LKELRKRKKGEKPRQIIIRVDVPSWQETAAPRRSAEDTEVVTEFLRDYPESERARLEDWYRERDRITRRLDECRLDPAEVETGLLVSFRDLLAPPDDCYWESPLGETRFDGGDAEYLVVEHYCTNPACDCREVHLAFRPIRPDSERPGKHVAEVAFRAIMSLDGHVRLEGLDAADGATARQVIALWEEDVDENELKKLKWRYDKMREIGRRSMSGYTRRQPAELRPRRSVSESSKPPTNRIGRNDPCPCGSGKKYKKCCARASDTRLF